MPGSIQLTAAALLALAPLDVLQAAGVKDLALTATDQGLLVSCHYKGQKVKATLTVAADLGLLTIDAHSVKVDGIPVPASWVEQQVAPYVPAHYYNGWFHAEIPGWKVDFAGCGVDGVLLKVERV